MSNIPKDIIQALPQELKFCNKLYDWLNRCDIKTHPTASVAALITIASAMTARSYYTQTKASTTLFTLLIAKTGAGKNIVVKAPSQIMEILNIQDKIISSKISSEGAMDDIFKEQPVAIHILDEFGDQLAHMIGDTGGYLKVVSAKMKNLYSLTNGIYYSGRYSSSGGKNKGDSPWILNRPCYGLTGITTQTQLFSQLNENMLYDGFLNRFIILNGQNVKSQFNDFPEYTFPQELKKHLESLIESISNKLKNIADGLITIPMTTEAKDYYTKFIGDADILDSDIYKYCENGENELKRAISVRWRENTIRLATALIAFEGLDKVSLDVLKWCYDLVKSSSIEFVKMFEEESNQTSYQILKDKAIEWFKSRGVDAQFTKTQLARSSRPFKNLKSKERVELLNDLVELEYIEILNVNGVIHYRYKP